MSSDEGGPGTGSSSVRRSRYNRGAFAGGRAWLGARFRLLAAASLFFSVGASVVLGGVRARLGPGFRVLAAAFPVFRFAVLFVLVVLVVRDLAFGRLAERRSDGDFLVRPPRRADRLAMLYPFQ